MATKATNSMYGTYSGRMSSSNLEYYKDQAMGVSLDDLIVSHKKEIRELNIKLKMKNTSLRRLILRESVMGEAPPEDHPNARDLSPNEVETNPGATGGTEEALDRSQFERNYVDPEFEMTLDILGGIIKHKRAKFDKLVNEIKSITLRLMYLDTQITKLHNLEAGRTVSVDEATKSEGRDRLILLKKYSDYVNNFLGILQTVPSESSTQEQKDNYELNMYGNSVDYVFYRNKLISILPGLDIQPSKPDWAKELPKLPLKFSEASKEDVPRMTEAITQFSLVIGNEIYRQRKVVFGAEGYQNEALETASSRVQQLLKSDAFSALIEHKDLKSLNEQLKIERKNVDDARKANQTLLQRVSEGLRSGLAGAGSLDTVIDKALVGLSSKISKNKAVERVTNLLYRSGLMYKVDTDTKTALDNYRRAEVRNKYGGNIPFEDEERIVGSNGEVKFVQKDKLIKVGDTYNDISLWMEGTVNRDPGGINQGC